MSTTLVKGVTAANGTSLPLKVTDNSDGTGTLNVGITPGTGATDLGKAEDAVHSSGDVGVMFLGVRKDTAAALAGTDGDYIPAIFDSTGRLHVNSSAALPAGTDSIGGTKDNGPHWTPVRTRTAITTATTTDITAAPTGGQKIYADDIIISTDTAQTISIVEETSGTVFAVFYMTASSTVQITPRDGLKAAVADKKLRAITSAAGNVSITACYHSEA